MKILKLVIVFAIGLNLSCGSKVSDGKSSATDKKIETKIENKIFGNYIVFYIDRDIVVKVYKYADSKNIGDYKSKPLFESKMEDEGGFITIERDYLLFDYGTSTNPHGLGIYDLRKSITISDGRYYYFPDTLHAGEKYRIYKCIGKTLNDEQMKRLDKSAVPEIIKQSELYYYDEYMCDPESNSITQNNRIIGALSNE